MPSAGCSNIRHKILRGVLYLRLTRPVDTDSSFFVVKNQISVTTAIGYEGPCRDL